MVGRKKFPFKRDERIQIPQVAGPQFGRRQQSRG
jgi:hypothetical protein